MNARGQRLRRGSRSALDDWRTYYHIDKPRPRLSPFGLMICIVIDHGYVLLREPQEQ
jgi:hypothetical protein